MSNTHEHAPVAGIEDLGYDRSEVKTIPVVVSSVVIIGFIVAVCIGCTAYYNSFRDAQLEKLQMEPVSADLLQLHDRENKELHSYATLDKATGTVRIPVERAMELIVAEGAEGGKWKFPTAPTAVKKPEDAAAAAQPGAAPAAGAPAAPAPAPAH